MAETFQCECGGPTRTLAADRVEHACRERYAPATSFYDGQSRYILHKRVQVNPVLTGGALKYNWFVDWTERR